MTISDALVDVVLDEVPKRRPSRLQSVLEWLVKNSKPPLGVRLVSDDGGTFSGFILVEDNRPLAMLAVRTGTQRVEWHRHERYMASIGDEFPEHLDDRLK